MAEGLSKSAELNRKLYERWMFVDSVLAPHGDYLDGSGFADYGYWEPETRSAREACENLMERLLEMLPEPRGKILDVACGLGATSKHLVRYFGAENVTGINVSPKQIEICRERAPGCTFLLMDAIQLEFEPKSFDHVICVEAAFHFDTREEFLRQALRVLKPGGHLVLADMLHDRWGERLNPLLHPRNHLVGPGAYARLLRRTGFQDVRIRDVTEECWIRSNRHLVAYVCQQFKAGKIDAQSFNRIMTARLLRILSTRYYLLAGGVKPARARAPEVSTPDGGHG